MQQQRAQIDAQLSKTLTPDQMRQYEQMKSQRGDHRRSGDRP